MISKRVTGPMHNEQADLYIRELIRILFDQLANNGRRNASKFRILKALYLVKKQLPESNPIKNSLAFYWYRYGTFSEVIVNVLDSDGSIVKNFDGSYTYLDETRKTPILPYDEPIQEAYDKIVPIAKNFISENTIREVYDDAPYQWYNYYNDFKDKFDRYYNYELRGLPHPYIYTDVIESLYKTLGTIPTEKRFYGFRLTYNDYVRILIPLLKTHKIHDCKDIFGKLCQLSDNIWNVFTKCVRIRYHDNYYDDCVKRWKEDYQDKLSELAKDINHLQDTMPVTEPKDLPDAEIEVIDFDVDSAKVYTPDELLKEIEKITNS